MYEYVLQVDNSSQRFDRSQLYFLLKSIDKQSRVYIAWDILKGNLHLITTCFAVECLQRVYLVLLPKALVRYSLESHGNYELWPNYHCAPGQKCFCDLDTPNAAKHT